jgi:predicted nucleic acid-binding protein
MVRAVFDTNLLIDYLNGVSEAGKEIGRYDQGFISVLTWMEVMAGAAAPVAAATEGFLSGFGLIALDDAVARRAVAVRQKYRMKLPDAIIWASAMVNNMLLVTRNTRDFPSDDPGVRMPYQRGAVPRQGSASF